MPGILGGSSVLLFSEDVTYLMSPLSGASASFSKAFKYLKG